MVAMGLAPILVEWRFELSIADRGYVLSTGRLAHEDLRKAYLGR